MYCAKCGNRLMGNENYCSNCGNEINSVTVNQTHIVNEDVSIRKNGDKTTSIVLGVLGIIGSLLFIFAPIALILSIIGLILGIKVSKKMGNVLGIVLNAIGLCLSIIASLIIILVLSLSWYTIRDSVSNLWQEDYYEEEIYYDNRYDF